MLLLNLLNSETKIFVITDQDATTVPSRQMTETGILNSAQFMLQ